MKSAAKRLTPAQISSQIANKTRWDRYRETLASQGTTPKEKALAMNRERVRRFRKARRAAARRAA